MKVKLALVGKNISHSKSPEIYTEFLQEQLVKYSLLDIEDEQQLPTAIELLNDYNGVSITSPYKKSYLTQVKLNDDTRKLGAINCLVKKDNDIYGFNTDYLAVKNIFTDLNKNFKFSKVIILGTGSMSLITQYYLNKIKFPFIVRSYRNEDISKINFCTEYAAEKLLVINACSRKFIFKGNISKSSTFWDFNYNFSPHSHLVNDCHYIDGLSLLKLQGMEALKLWKIK